MSAFFDLPSFIRRVSNPLLQRFFSDVEAFAEFDWATAGTRKTGPILQRFNLTTPEQRQKAFEIFRRTESLASSAGTQMLIEASRSKDPGIASKLAAMKSALDRAFWMCMEYPEIIDAARNLARIEALPKRMWETRQGLPMRQLVVSDAIREELQRLIKEMYQPEQCRADYCEVEHMRREGGIDLFFAYPADYWDEREGYDSAGQFERTSWNPAFKIVFAYHSADGSLDIYAQGGTKIRKRLAHIFARAVLGAEQELKLPDLDSFDLDVLKNPNLFFPTNPADRITRVRIQSLKLRFHGGKPATFEVSLDARRREGSIHEVLADKFKEQHARLVSATVAGAVIQAFFLTPAGKERSVMFRLSMPSFCDLEDSQDDQILRAYLPIWGIEKNANSLATAA